MPGVAWTVQAMLDALSYDRVDVLGVSLGGMVAQHLARQAPTGYGGSCSPQGARRGMFPEHWGNELVYGW
jgi:hypothetical protein